MKPRDLEQIDALIARRLAASAPEPATTRHVNGRKVEAHAAVVDGMVYDLKPRRWLNSNTIGWIVTIVILAALAWLILPGLLIAPQITVDAPPAPTARPLPTRAPAQDAPAAPVAPVVVVMPAPTDMPAWVGGGGTQIDPQAQDIAPAWHAPMAPEYDVCAAWRVPQPWPAECGEQAGWHAPMVKP